VPVALAQAMFNSNTLFRILVEANSREAIEPAKAQVAEILKQRHRRRGRRHGDHPGRRARHLRPLLGALTLGVAGIAAISLAVAGILVMNVMLVAVTQRTGEIGLLKALGATGATIRTAFLDRSGDALARPARCSATCSASRRLRLRQALSRLPRLPARLGGDRRARHRARHRHAVRRHAGAPRRPARSGASLDEALTCAADSLHLALRAITAQRLRSFLTLLGIAVGIAAVILLTSIGEGIHRFVLAEFTQFGTNVISVTPGQGQDRRPALRPAELGPPAHAGRCRGLRTPAARHGMTPSCGATPRSRQRPAAAHDDLRRQCRDARGVSRVKVRSGQFLPPMTKRSARAFVVLGAKLKNELFGSENALGARLRIGGLQFRVIGVMEAKGQFLGIDLDDTAYIPAARAQELFNRDGLMKSTSPTRKACPAARVSALDQGTLIARHGREDFTITTQEDMLRTLSNILDVLTMAVGALGGISLLVGGVGIVTIMTIAVTERTRRNRPAGRARRATAAHHPRALPRRGGRAVGARRLCSAWRSASAWRS
jgi:putative ABC transport system permease protein